MVAFFFPGQGSQHAGMGKALAEAYPAAREVFEAADDALSEKLSTLCFEGPEEDLKRTENTQPAILTTSIAALAALRAERPDLAPTLAAGHSLGEFSALVAVGALAFTDAVRLVRLRGQAMQAAVPQGEGAMAAVIGLTRAQVETICGEVSAATGGLVAPANFNSPEQTVISGAADAVEKAQASLTEAGAKRVMPLPVSAPFHCALMSPAAEALEAALGEITVSAPNAPVITNVEATPNTDPERVKALLVQQVTAPVRWVETVEHAVGAGVTQALEIGPGKVLMGLVRRIDRSLKVTPVGDPAGVTKALS